MGRAPRPLAPALAALLLAAAPTRALLSSELFVASEVLGIPAMAPFQQAPTGPLQDDFDFIDPPPATPFGEVHVSTFVDYGLLRLDARMEIAADDFDPVSTSLDSGTRASGTSHDLVTISAPGLAGTPGTFVARVDLDGFLQASATGDDPPFSSFATADVVLSVAADSIQVQRARGCNSNLGPFPACLSGDPLGVQVLDPLPFTFGTPFTLRVAADATTFNRTVPGGTTDAIADFAFTVRWLGIQEVADQGGAPVAGFSVGSQSGVDWAQPVPEPAAALAEVVAVAALGSLARARSCAARGTWS
jgi:hypothetical protein